MVPFGKEWMLEYCYATYIIGNIYFGALPARGCNISFCPETHPIFRRHCSEVKILNGFQSEFFIRLKNAKQGEFIENKWVTTTSGYWPKRDVHY
jgi:hypothetical protein